MLGFPVDMMTAALNETTSGVAEPATFLPFQGGRFNPVGAAAQSMGFIKPPGQEAEAFVERNLIREPIGGSEHLRGLMSDVGAAPRTDEDVPPEARAIFKGGRVLGGSVPLPLHRSPSRGRATTRLS